MTKLCSTSSSSSRLPCVAFPVVLLSALGTLTLLSCASSQDVIVSGDSISRELTVYNALDTVIDDAISREVSVYNDWETHILDAVSRELSVLYDPNLEGTEVHDATGREISVWNGSPVLVLTDAVSREMTVWNDPDRPEAVDTVSREMSIWNDLDKPEMTDAVSRELTMLNRYLVDFKLAADGDEVAILGSEGVGVSAVFEDCIYVESLFLYSGIRVVGGTANVGDRVNILGTMATNADGERYIQAASVTTVGSLNISPVGMGSRQAHCGPLDYEEDTGSGQRGVTDGTGTCVIGLFVRMAGHMSVSPIDGSWSIDDGSGRSVVVELPAAANVSEGQFVVTEGIVSLRKSGVVYLPVLRVTRLNLF